VCVCVCVLGRSVSYYFSSFTHPFVCSSLIDWLIPPSFTYSLSDRLNHRFIPFFIYSFVRRLSDWLILKLFWLILWVILIDWFFESFFHSFLNSVTASSTNSVSQSVIQVGLRALSCSHKLVCLFNINTITVHQSCSHKLFVYSKSALYIHCALINHLFIRNQHYNCTSRVLP